MELISRNSTCMALVLLLLPMWVSSAEEGISEDTTADTRVLIDVSGSMKHNDPKNLRQPALRLLVGLLPKDSRAGVWTFGQYVNEEIPLGKVDDGWRGRARTSSSKIHSRGLYTDIEEVLRRSTEDWKQADGKYSRHVVILTDGVVDISKSSITNARSRKRITNDILPKLKSLGVRVHSIALSKSADHHLLKKMSGATDGWYEQVDDADQLKRIFLRIFEKVSKPDTVPISKDNKFRIDKSVKEATLLVFHSEDDKPTQVKTPGGDSFSSDNPPNGVSWHRDDGYDLMTITKPEAGEWQILADVDPDNRVIVVTDLKMVASALPNRVLQGELNKIKVLFKDRGQKIVDKGFLDLVGVEYEHSDDKGISEPRPVFDNGKDGDEQAHDGVFTFNFGKNIGKGQVEVVLTAEGKTFVREKHYTLESVPAVTVDTLEGERGGKSGLMATVMPEPNLVVGQSLEIEAQLTPEKGNPVAVMFLPGVDGMSRESWIDLAELKGNWNLDISIKADSVTGSKLEMDLDPIPIVGESSAEQEPVKDEPKPELQPEPVATPDPAPEQVATSEPESSVSEEQEEDGSYINIILFVLFNILVIGIGGGAYWYLRKRNVEIFSELSEEGITGELTADDVDTEESEEAEPEAKEQAADTVTEESDNVEDVAEVEDIEEETDKEMDDLADLDPNEDEDK